MKTQNRVKSLKLFVFSLALLFALCSFVAPNAEAFSMSNSNYTIRIGNPKTTSKDMSNKTEEIGGETKYKIRRGFSHNQSFGSFTFSINQRQIDFGVLTATNPVTRTNDLAVSIIGSANGYSIIASEDHELLVLASGALIPDTTCDDGTCTQSISAAWTSTLVYGFGYRCDNLTGTDCASGFSTSTFYKQFADESKSEAAQSVMTGSNAGENKKARIIYKVNISGTQAAGTYSNVITYIATPTF